MSPAFVVRKCSDVCSVQDLLLDSLATRNEEGFKGV